MVHNKYCMCLLTCVQVTVDPVVALSSRTSEGSTLTPRHSKRVGDHGNTITGGNHDYNRDDLVIKLKSLEQEHQRLLSSHNQTEVSFIVSCISKVHSCACVHIIIIIIIITNAVQTSNRVLRTGKNIYTMVQKIFNMYDQKLALGMTLYKFTYSTWENFAGEKLMYLANREQFAKIFLTNIHRYIENVFGMCTDFSTNFFANSFYLYGSPKLFPCTVVYALLHCTHSILKRLKVMENKLLEEKHQRKLLQDCAQQVITQCIVMCLYCHVTVSE